MGKRKKHALTKRKRAPDAGKRPSTSNVTSESDHDAAASRASSRSSSKSESCMSARACAAAPAPLSAQHYVQSPRAVVCVPPLPHRYSYREYLWGGSLPRSSSSSWRLSRYVAASPPLFQSCSLSRSACVRPRLHPVVLALLLLPCLQLTEHAAICFWQAIGHQERRLRRLRHAPRHQRDGCRVPPWHAVHGRLPAAIAVCRLLMPPSVRHACRACRGHVWPRIPRPVGRRRPCWAPLARVRMHGMHEALHMKGVSECGKMEVKVRSGDKIEVIFGFYIKIRV